MAGPGGAQASCPFRQPFGSGGREGGGAGGGVFCMSSGTYQLQELGHTPQVSTFFVYKV